MEISDFDRLIQEYKKAFADKWDSIAAGSVRIPLRNVFVMLEAVESSGSMLEAQRPDMVPTDERLAHSSFAPPKTDNHRREY